MSKITFIIPTIGRPTLLHSIECLKTQTVPDWNAIIVFDGITPTIENDDSRIMIMQIEKLGQGHNSAGLVRNEGIKCATSEWIAFLDDDDTISNDYVETFINEVNTYNPDVLLFRMQISIYGIVPSIFKNSNNLIPGDVGISFALKKQIFDAGCIFVPSQCEDWILMEKMISNNYKVMVSPYVKYFVRQNPSVLEICPRLFINMEDITLPLII